MKDGATKSFMQAYNGQAAVDSHAQIIVAAALTQDANDKKQLLPMLEQVEKNLGRKPEHASMDAGYFSEAAVTDPKVEGVDLLASALARNDPPLLAKSDPPDGASAGPSPRHAPRG